MKTFMTLRKSIALSLTLHAVLFGTGLAFARYGGELLHGYHAPIMVALVGREGMLPQAGGAKQASADPLRDHPREQKQEPEHEAPPAPSESSAPEAALQPQDSGHQPAASAGQQSGQQGSSQAAPQTREGNGEGAQQAAAGVRSGSVSSEEWAVIVSSIERAKSYPRLARERGIQGVVRLRFRVKPRGDVDRVEIVASSGSEILDTASVRTLYQAGPLPYVSGWVEVPIAYVLK